MKKTLSTLSLAVALGAGPALGADSGVEIGTLTCKVTDVTNLVVYTSQSFDCGFKGKGGKTESYTGEIDKIGIDLSIKDDFTIIWTVLAPTDDAAGEKSLAGTYVGAGADVALSKGGGAQVLVGGGENSFSLQPVSVSGVDGVGASLGLESFTLK